MKTWRFVFFSFCSLTGASVHAGEKENLPRLVRQLGDPEIDVRGAAFRSLLESGAVEPEGTLAALPAGGSDIEVQESCRRLREEIPWAHRGWLARQVRGEDSLWKFVRQVGGEDFLFRECADRVFNNPSWSSVKDFHREIWQQGRKQDQVLDLLVLLLSHPNEEARRAAVHSLGEVGCPRVIPYLLPCFQDPTADVRRTAMAAAVKLVGEGTAPSDLVSGIECLLRDPRADVRLGAVQALLWLGAGKTACVMQCLEDETVGVRQSVVELLGLLGDPSVVGRLMAMVEREGEDSQVRRPAVFAVWDLADQPFFVGGCDDLLFESARRWWAEHKSDPRFALQLGDYRVPPK